MYSEFTSENTVTSEDAEREFESVLALIDKFNIVLITRDGKPDLVAMGFHYYLERFGSLLPEDEYKKLKAMDAQAEDDNTESAVDNAESAVDDYAESAVDDYAESAVDDSAESAASSEGSGAP